MTSAIATLAEVQAFLGRAVLRESAVDEGTNASETVKLVSRGIRLSPVEQVAIYREQFWLRHIGAMKEDFVTIDHLLGEEGFRAVCERYFAVHPPRSFTLRDLGDRFADFVKRTEPWASDPLVHACARLEWAFVEAFDAPDAPPLDSRSLADAPEDAWGRARITLHPSVQRVALSHPAQLYRRDVRDEKNPERPAAVPTYVVVYRGPEKLMYIDLEPLAFQLLERLGCGEPLAGACERAAVAAGVVDSSELESKVGAWFQSWAAYGWISRVDFGD